MKNVITNCALLLFCLEANGQMIYQKWINLHNSSQYLFIERDSIFFSNTGVRRSYMLLPFDPKLVHPNYAKTSIYIYIPSLDADFTLSQKEKDTLIVHDTYFGDFYTYYRPPGSF